LLPKKLVLNFSYISLYHNQIPALIKNNITRLSKTCVKVFKPAAGLGISPPNFFVSTNEEILGA
ncbi:MAG: hypothetical protein V1763_01475, partial [Parcubacteria group bacterium]